jgi:hypothetical protein
MIRRCEDSSDKEYKNYGARGIEVCVEWKSVDVFIADMFPSFKEELYLDRIDVDKDYCKDNCRWVTSKESASNRRCAAAQQSKISGVTWDKKSKKWKARLDLGKFATEEEAVKCLSEARGLIKDSAV